jgi:hypothetical protein
VPDCRDHPSTNTPSATRRPLPSHPHKWGTTMLPKPSDQAQAGRAAADPPAVLCPPKSPEDHIPELLQYHTQKLPQDYTLKRTEAVSARPVLERGYTMHNVPIFWQPFSRQATRGRKIVAPASGM